MSNKTPNRNRYLILSIVIILIITMTPGNGKLGGNQLDKVGHFLIFLFLSININFKYHNHYNLIKVLFFAILFGFATEVVQQFIPGRSLDFYDALADTLGVVSGYYLYLNFKPLFDKIMLKLGA